MEEDIKRVKRILNENIDYIFEFDSGEEHICIRDILEIIQKQEEENENLKQAAIINKNLYEEVCNKNKEWAERNKRQQEENKKLNIKIIHQKGQLNVLYAQQKDSIPKSLIKKIRDKAELEDFYTVLNVIDDLNKILGD